VARGPINELTRVSLWLVVKVPRGPVKGCHVAPGDWFVGLYKIIVAWHRGQTRDLLGWQRDWRGWANRQRPHGGPC
jgi:hypothetical protein